MAIQDDIRKFELEINTASKNGATLSELTKIEKTTANLRKENEQLEKVMAHLAASGKKNTDEYKRMETQLKNNRKEIRGNNEQMKGLRKTLDITYLSMNQLKKRANELRGSLNGMSQAANPEEYARLDKELKDVTGQMDKLKGKSSGLNSTMATFKKLAPWLGVAALGSALKDAWNNASETRKEFARYEAILKVSTGSQKQANKELKQLQDFAAETPFQLSELTDAYVRLTNYGLKPNREEMRQQGDLASSVGKSYLQLAEAQADAVTGEFERLKEFGIKAKKEGDQITFTFKEQQTVVENNATAIKNYITGLGDLEGVAGSMAEISRTWGGAASNAADATDTLFNAIGKKLEPAVVSLMGTYSRLSGAVAQWINGGAAAELRNEQAEVNRLVIQLQDANIEEGTRARLLGELKTLAPDIATALQNEKTDLTTLTTALDTYNSKMALKILLKEEEAKVDAQKGKTETARDKAMKREAEMVDAMVESLDWFREKSPEYVDQVQGIMNDGTLSTLEKANQINAIAVDVNNMGNRGLRNAIQNFMSLNTDYQKQSSVLDELVAKAEEKKKQLNAIFGDDGSGDDDKTKTKPETTVDTSKLTAAQELEYKLQELFNNAYRDNSQLNQGSLPYQMIKLSPEEEEEIDAEFEYLNNLFLSDDENKRALIVARHKWGLDSEEVYQAKLTALLEKGENERAEKLQKSFEITQKLAQDIGILLGETMADSQATFDEFGKGLVLTLLRTLKSMVPVIVATILGKELAGKGPLGLITSGVLSAVFLTAVSAAESKVKSSMSTKQRATGKYDVVGADDGLTYRNVPYNPNPESGIYNQPTLISERGGEAVFTADHVKNIMTYNPGLMRDAMAYRNGVPQTQQSSQPVKETIIERTVEKDRIPAFSDSDAVEFKSYAQMIKYIFDTVKSVEG